MCDGATDECAHCGFGVRGVVEALPAEDKVSVPIIQIEPLLASYSADLIASRATIRKPVKIAGRLWVMTSGVCTGAKGYSEINFYEVVPREGYAGNLVKFQSLNAEQQERRRETRMWYDGIAVRCGDAEFVLRGPERTTPGHGFGRVLPKTTGKQRKRQDGGEGTKAKPRRDGALTDDWTERQLPLALIDLRADNPFRVARDEDVSALARDIERQGLIYPILVRPTEGGRFEVWVGEKRFRAHRLLGRELIRAEVYPPGLPDAVLIAKRFSENARHAGMNPVQEAEGLRQLLASGAYASQKELGQALGLSQGEISLRLRLTELPADWRQRVIAREISTSHAKHLYPWLDLPAVLAQAAKTLQDWEKNHGRQPNERDFEGLVQSAARAASKPITKDGPFSSPDACPFSVSPELRAQLDVRPLKNPWGGKPEQRAFNVTLWQQKAKEAQQRAAAKAKSESAAAPQGKSARIAKVKAAVKPPAGPSEHSVLRILGDWARRQIKEVLKPKDKKLLMRLMVIGGLVYDGLAIELDDIARRLGIKGTQGSGIDPEGCTEWWAKLSALEDAQLADVMHSIVIGACAASYGGLPDELAIAVARSLGVTPADSWRPQADDLRWYDEPALRALAAEFGHDVGKAKTKDALTKALVKCWKPGDLPAAFRAALEPEAR
ncbi:MAG: ParB/RepB/Spo0J family partition protein [Phycisphaerales bacterium]|nr:ParB/RepB/Spo0J family partition protein [Phycisphaerales bacterium]